MPPLGSPFPGPVWKEHGSATIGCSSVGTQGPNIDVGFVYLANSDDSFGWTRVVPVTRGDATTPVTVSGNGPQIPETGMYYPCSNLAELWFVGQSGDETVTIVYAKR